MRQTTPPRTPGRDFAGTVVAGPAAWLGAEVWGTGGDLGFTRDGSHAQLLRLPVAALARKPANLSFAQAGAVGVNYVTAAIGLDYTALKPGETILVLGASGGVGGAVCAIARQRGATVIAAQRGRPQPDQSAAQTAHRFIDLNVISPGEAVTAFTSGRGVDVVFDCIGNIPLTTSAMGVLAMRGRVVVIAGTPGEKLSLELIPFYRREARLIGVDSLKRSATDCATLLDALRPGFENGAFPAPVIAHSFPLEQARDAYRLVNSGTRGRVILTPAPTGAPGHLDHKLGKPLGRPKVGCEQAAVGVDNAHQGDLRKIMAFGEHLRAQKNIHFPGKHGGACRLKLAFSPHAVAVYPQNATPRKPLFQRLFDLLSPNPQRYRHRLRAAGHRLAREIPPGAAVVATQAAGLTMQHQTRIAALASGNPATGVTHDQRRIASAVQEQQYLLALPQDLVHRLA
jgi:NADPH:quinone reductase-like Zn-dependent oxidoreductase